MELSAYLPFWKQLTAAQQERLQHAAVLRSASAGTLLTQGTGDCIGLLVIRSGQLRGFLTSPEGREITVYRLLERDICLFSASCMMQNIQFDLSIQVEKDAVFWVIPPDLYKKLMAESAPVANYTNQLMASRFSEVMWLLEQILWKSQDKRLAAFLLEESALEDSQELRITHEKIAGHLGTAREVVTRMLRYLQSEGMVELARGTIRLTAPDRLRQLAREDAC